MKILETFWMLFGGAVIAAAFFAGIWFLTIGQG